MSGHCPSTIRSIIGDSLKILTDNETLAKKAKHLTTQAKVPHKWNYVHDMIGYNYRLTNLAAALGVAQLEQFPGFIENKRNIVEKYREFFSGTDIKFVNEPENATSNYWQIGRASCRERV